MKKSPTGNSFTDSVPDTSDSSRCYKGIVIHDGYASGKALKKASGFPNVPETLCESTDHEIELLNQALSKAVSDLEVTISALEPDSESHAIFSSHQLMLQDPVLLDEVRKSIQNCEFTADYAWISALKTYYEQWKRAARGSSMEQRSSDIIDIANRVYRLLNSSGESCDSNVGILVTEELSASDALALDPSFVKGVVSERGNETSHSAILVRSKGIPVVFGIRNLCDAVPNDAWIAIDGGSGEVFVGYDSKVDESIQKQRSLYEQKMPYFASQVGVKSEFMGEQVHLLANVSSVDQIQDAMKAGAQGVGLFRTEFLYLNRANPPSEDEQVRKYQDALRAVKGQKLVIRTADFGGDKPISYLKWDAELNPFLGKRGIRYSLVEESLLKIQLRAILRASVHGKIDIMFPMISTVDEVIQVKQLLELYKNELTSNGTAVGEVAIGVMIEVPSAALEIREILKEVEFISIGTNDLIQYVMAADRTLDTLGNLASSMQPAVLKLIKRVIHEAKDQHKEVSICGEMAGDVRLTPLLLAFGLREFSMSIDQIPKVKEVTKHAPESHIMTLLDSFDSCRTSKEVSELLKQ
jgi:phosphotransferase system enzyme I (PtsI)